MELLHRCASGSGARVTQVYLERVDTAQPGELLCGDLRRVEHDGRVVVTRSR